MDMDGIVFSTPEKHHFCQIVRGDGCSVWLVFHVGFFVVNGEKAKMNVFFEQWLVFLKRVNWVDTMFQVQDDGVGWGADGIGKFHQGHVNGVEI
jgi:hypothetical protein